MSEVSAGSLVIGISSTLTVPAGGEVTLDTLALPAGTARLLLRYANTSTNTMDDVSVTLRAVGSTSSGISRAAAATATGWEGPFSPEELAALELAAPSSPVDVDVDVHVLRIAGDHGLELGPATVLSGSSAGVAGGGTLPPAGEPGGEGGASSGSVFDFLVCQGVPGLFADMQTAIDAAAVAFAADVNSIQRTVWLCDELYSQTDLILRGGVSIRTSGVPGSGATAGTATRIEVDNGCTFDGTSGANVGIDGGQWLTSGAGGSMFVLTNGSNGPINLDLHRVAFDTSGLVDCLTITGTDAHTVEIDDCTWQQTGGVGDVFSINNPNALLVIRECGAVTAPSSNGRDSGFWINVTAGICRVFDTHWVNTRTGPPSNTSMFDMGSAADLVFNGGSIAVASNAEIWNIPAGAGLTVVDVYLANPAGALNAVAGAGGLSRANLVADGNTGVDGGITLTAIPTI